MVADQDPDVKQKRSERFLAWVDTHPRCGWYLMAILLLNTILNILDLLH